MPELNADELLEEILASDEDVDEITSVLPKVVVEQLESNTPEEIEHMASKLVISSLENVTVNGQQLLLQDWQPSLFQMAHNGAVSSVEFDAVTFIQGPNANSFAFKDSELDSFASSFAGQPFLRNHNTRDIEARDGTIMSSTNDSGEFKQRIKLTTQRGIRSFAEGQIDRFSIGWDFDEILCSVCGLDYLGGECPHLAGRTYGELKAEILFSNPTGVETSAVNVPAVAGTRILAALSNKKLEKKFMETDPVDETGAIEPVAQEQGDDNRWLTAADRLAPFILGKILESPELLKAIVGVLHLEDIDSRIGAIELATQTLNDNQQRLAAEVDQSMGVLPKGEHILELKVNPWDGYKGSALSAMQDTGLGQLDAPTVPAQPVNVRPRKVVAQQAQQSSSIGGRQARGESFLGMLGGNQ